MTNYRHQALALVMHWSRVNGERGLARVVYPSIDWIGHIAHKPGMELVATVFLRSDLEMPSMTMSEMESKFRGGDARALEEFRQYSFNVHDQLTKLAELEAERIRNEARNR